MGFRRLGARDLHTWRVFRLVEADFEAPDASRFTRTYLHHPGAVGIVAVDGDEAVLVRQYRPALDRVMLEIPAGTLDKSAESPEACARRELAEEVGAVADHWEHLTTYAVAAGISDEELHLYLASGLTFGARAADGVEEESMTIERIALVDVPDAIADGQIADAKTIIGLLLARQST
jgi:8-oxo-dGTP pyrophosphatase MutT (NUDIX family)